MTAPHRCPHGCTAEERTKVIWEQFDDEDDSKCAEVYEDALLELIK